MPGWQKKFYQSEKKINKFQLFRLLQHSQCCILHSGSFGTGILPPDARGKAYPCSSCCKYLTITLRYMKKTIIALLATGGVCSVASAALSETQLANPYQPTLNSTATSLDMKDILPQDDSCRSFTAVMTLDVNALSVFTPGNDTSAAKKTPIISWIVAGEKGHSVNISVNNNSSGGKITQAGFYVEYEQDNNHTNCALPGDTGAAGNKFGTNGDAAAAALSSVDWTKVSSAALTLTYNGDSDKVGPLGVQIYFTTIVDGEAYTLNAASTNIRWTNGSNLNTHTIGYEPTYLDSLTIYSGYATAEQAELLNKQLLVPEPTTATLSLLALAGLAVRRRRK